MSGGSHPDPSSIKSEAAMYRSGPQSELLFDVGNIAWFGFSSVAFGKPEANLSEVQTMRIFAEVIIELFLAGLPVM